jgi:hypothetical protein
MPQVPSTKYSPSNGSGTRFYKVQIKAWTNFDPTQADLLHLAQAAEQGAAIVTVREVIETAADLEQIEDEEVRKRFEIVAAAETLVQNLVNVPPHLKDRLRAALQ